MSKVAGAVHGDTDPHAEHWEWSVWPFAVSMGTVEVQPQDFVTIGLMATLAVERAIVKGVRAATGLHGVPSAGEWLGRG